MKKIIGISLIILILINTCTMTVMASSASSESKNIEEANLLLKDLENNGRDYYLQYSTFDDPVFVNIAESYLDNKPQFYLTNSWSNIINKEYRRKGTFKNEYIYDLIIMGFLKYEADDNTYNDSLINREKAFATDLYSVLGDEVGETLDESPLSDSTWENFYNTQTIEDLNLALNIVKYAGESYESYLNITASKMALLESKRDKLALFRASVEEASKNDDKDYINAMNLIIDSINKADPTKYLNKKTGVECTNTLISVVEDVVKEVNPLFGLLDLSVSGIDLLFNSSDSASNDIKLAYLYLTDTYLHDGLRSTAKEFMDSNNNDPSKRSTESARTFIDAFKTYLRFQQYGNKYADEWLDNYIQVRSGPIKRLFHKNEIQDAKNMKEQCKDENTRIDNMLKNVNELEKDEDVWKINPEKKEETINTNEKDSEYSPYASIVDKLFSKYGSLRIVQNNNDWENEANGLCYLNLIDFTGDGEDELMAVCKNEDEEHYSCFVYQQIKNQAKQVFYNEQIECNFDFDYETIYVSYSEDTGYIIGSGWEGDSEEDRTFYWYKNGAFEPVFRRKGYWDSEQEKIITEEESITVDLFDEDHSDEIWSNHKSITLRALDEYDADGDFFTAHKLQKTIDDTLRKLGLSIKDLPSSITFSEEKLNEMALVAIYQCMEKDLDEWIPDIEDKETFWDVMCFYCDFTSWIYSVDYPREGEDGQYQVIPNELLKNGAYALYKDFDGNLPIIDDGIWRAKYYDEASTGITVGDSAPFIITSENYQQNDDGTIDGEYVTEYWGDIPAGTYKVHFEPNVNCNKVNSETIYYHCISRVERVNKPTTAKNNEPEESSKEDDDSWKESYVEYIENDTDIASSSEWCTCGLIYLDDNEIPELIIDYGIEALGTRIVSFTNGDTVSSTFARTGGIHYIERKGLVYNSIGLQGVMNDELANLDDEGFHSLGRGYRYGEEQDFIHYTHFNWNNEEVSEEEYYSNINNYFNDEQSVRWNSYSDDIPGSAYRYPPDEMCEYLLDN